MKIDIMVLYVSDLPGRYMERRGITVSTLSLEINMFSTYLTTSPSFS